jgi:hypothetical protein
MSTLRKEASHFSSHRRDITFDISLIASPRNTIETTQENCLIMPQEFPQLGFRLQYCKIAGNKVNVKMVIFYSYMSTFLFLGLEDSFGHIRQYPAVIIPQRRSRGEELVRHIILGDVPVEQLMGRKMVLIFVLTNDPKYITGPSKSVADFTKYVGSYLSFTSWTMVRSIENYLGTVWSEALKNQVVRGNFGRLESRIGAEGRFRIKCSDGTYVRVSLRRLKEISHYYQAYDSFQLHANLPARESHVQFGVETVKIFLEFLYTSRLATGTCSKLFSTPELLVNCMDFAEYYLVPDFQIYLHFILTWKIVSHPYSVEELLMLYRYVEDPKIKIIADALITMARRNDPQYGKLVAINPEYAGLEPYFKWLDEDNFFVTTFNSDSTMQWEI